MGGTKKMCCLVGFKLRVGAYFMLLAEEEYIRQVVCKDFVPALPKFKKMAVVDLFKWAKPTEQVDLALVQNADRLSQMLVKIHNHDVQLWNEVPVVMSAQKSLLLEETMLAQKEALKKKQEREEARLKKKKLREDAKNKKAEQQRLLRKKRAQENKQKKMRLTAKMKNERRNYRRKRDREIEQRVTATVEAKSRKVQRVALSTLADQHKSQLASLAKKHDKEVLVLKGEIEQLKESLAESKRINEHTKMQATIDTLRSELELLRKSRSKVPSPIPVAPPSRAPKSSSSSSASGQRAKSGELVRTNSVGSSSSSSVGSSTDTPLDPKCATPYDPLAPVCAPPVPSTGRSTSGGYHYMARHIMRGSYPPTRRQLRYTPPPQYGEYNGGFGGWY